MKPIRPLSEREREVARLVGRGLSYREIAVKLNVAERTARQHVASIATKLPPPAGAITPYRRVMLWAAASV